MSIYRPYLMSVFRAPIVPYWDEEAKQFRPATTKPDSMVHSESWPDGYRIMTCSRACAARASSAMTPMCFTAPLLQKVGGVSLVRVSGFSRINSCFYDMIIRKMVFTVGADPASARNSRGNESILIA